MSIRDHIALEEMSGAYSEQSLQIIETKKIFSQSPEFISCSNKTLRILLLEYVLCFNRWFA